MTARTFPRAAWYLPAFMLLVCALPVHAEDGAENLDRTDEWPRPTLRALATDDQIVVDGLLDESIWTQAEVGTGFRQREPDQFEPANEETEVRVVFTTKTLYVGIQAFDSDPSALIARELGQDVALSRDDSVAFLLDTFHDRRNGYFFETNLVASRNDGYVTDEGNSSTDWDALWRVATSRNADGWVAEFAIPFSMLRFDPNLDTWGFQVRRTIRRSNESTFWAPVGRDASFTRVSQAGFLTGMGSSSGLRSGRDLRIKPYVSASANRTVLDDGSVSDQDDSDMGLDVKWGITRGSTLDLTVNTDFAETEVDEQQVNLTRFSLFLPEKREFFQENAGIFDFAPETGRALRVFFSRRIGIDDDGRQVPLDFGARLAGREGPWSLGVIGAFTGSLDADIEAELPAVQSTDWGVVRVKRNLGRRSNVGIVATERRSGTGDRNTVWGVDGSWKPTDRLEIWGFSTSSSGSTEDSDGWAGGLGAQFRGDFWNWNVKAMSIDDTFDPQVGFVRRSGIKNYEFKVEWEPRPDWDGVRSLSWELEADIFTLEDGTLETVDASFDLFSMVFDSGDRFSFFTQYRFEELFEPFEIFDGVILPDGEYDWVDFGLFGRTADSRILSVRGFVVGGDFFDGRRLAHNLNIQWRPGARWQMTTQWNRNDIRLRGGSFETNVWRQRVRYAWSADLNANMFLQYNDAAELTGLNLRVGWRFRPGSDLFVVYNQTWDSPSAGELIEADRQLGLKLTYSWNL